MTQGWGTFHYSNGETQFGAYQKGKKAGYHAFYDSNKQLSK